MVKDILVGLLFVGIIGVGIVGAIGYFDEEEIIITVTEKERVMDRHNSDGDVDSRYLIWSDEETFENVDSLLKWKFNSSDLYGQLKVGETYRCQVYGWRVRFLSSYRNIVKCTPVVQSEDE